MNELLDLTAAVRLYRAYIRERDNMLRWLRTEAR